jgi:putative addiction module component (TIGR02574 family)
MTTTAIRKQLHQYIDNAEEKKLKAIYTMLESEIENNAKSMLTEEQKNELDYRLEEYLNGKTKSYSWEETIKKIKKPKK